jgi:hypothetical protein
VRYVDCLLISEKEIYLQRSSLLTGDNINSMIIVMLGDKNFLIKLSTSSPCDLAIPPLGVFINELKT